MSVAFFASGFCSGFGFIFGSGFVTGLGAGLVVGGAAIDLGLFFVTSV